MVRCCVEGCDREAVVAYGSIALCEYHLRRYIERVERLVREHGKAQMP